jgi:GAF domain-containing protein
MARRAPAAYLCLPVGARHEVAFLPFPRRAPLFVINTGSTIVSLTLPDEPDAAQVAFARQLAAQAAAYAVAVERRFRGLAPLGPGREVTA